MSRYLGIDFGPVRIGIAIGDDQTRMALPLTQLDHPGDDAEAARRIADLVRREEVEAVVIGMPVHMDGTRSQQTQRTQAFVDVLERTLAVPVVLFDERLSTAEADQKLEQQPLSKKQRKARRDALAAQTILQDFLNHNHSDQMDD